MKFALMFPGQGSQKIGMGLDLYTNNKTGKEIIEGADKIIGKNISKIFLYGPENELNQTINTQPSIVINSIALTLILNEELTNKKLSFTPFACCGHSLGEFTALWYANIFQFEDLIKLVYFRGSLMQNTPTGSMAAILNIELKQIEELIAKEFKNKVVIANYNSQKQFVISGEKESIILACEKLKAIGGKAIILPVSGAFHSPLMLEPSKYFSKEIGNVPILSKAKAPIFVYQNVDGLPNNDPKIIIQKIKNQMISPVYWTQIINNLVKDGVTSFIEIGPGKILTGLVKKINPEVNCYNISDLLSLNDFLISYEHRFLRVKS